MFTVFVPIWALSLSVLLADSPKSDTPSSRLVTFDNLQARLASPNLRLIDPRPLADYEKGHLPGAVWVDVKAVEKLAAKPGSLTDAKPWEAWIAPLGIGPDTEVVICDGEKQLAAARLWWLLSYLGVPNVGLIDGNVPLWVAEKRPVTTEVPKVEPREFRVTFRNERHATRADVISALQSRSATIVDARSAGEYTGTEKRAKRGGHVPTACSLEWSNLVDKDGRFLAEPELKAKVAKAGVKAGDPLITHCQSGGRASVNAFVFERLGFKTRNYYLGWSDWGNAEDTPVNVEADSKP